MPRRRNRKNESIPEVMYQMLLLLPWWGGPLLAGLTYAGLAWGLPALFLRDRGAEEILQMPGEMLANVSTALAPLVGLGVLGLGAVAEAQKWWDRRLLDGQTDAASIRELDWRAFERLLAEAFRREGYFVEPLGGHGPDGGVDLRLHKGGARTLVQCKHWKARKVGVKVVRELFGVMTSVSADGGVVVTSGDFTREAETFARANGMQLIGGEALLKMIRAVQRNPSMDKPAPAPATPAPAAQATAPAPVRKIAAPTPTAQPAAPACPRCGGAMALRTARKGDNAGRQFWGCTAYPKCQGVVNING